MTFELYTCLFVSGRQKNGPHARAKAHDGLHPFESNGDDVDCTTPVHESHNCCQNTAKPPCALGSIPPYLWSAARGCVP